MRIANIGDMASARWDALAYGDGELPGLRSVPSCGTNESLIISDFIVLHTVTGADVVFSAHAKF